MNSITVIYDQSHYLYRWLKPLFASRKEFKELGYKIRYSSIWDYLPIFDGKRREKMEKKAINRACNGKHDIIFMAFHHSTSYLGQLDSEERIEIIKNVKKHCRNANCLGGYFIRCHFSSLFLFLLPHPDSHNGSVMKKLG